MLFGCNNDEHEKGKKSKFDISVFKTDLQKINDSFKGDFTRSNGLDNVEKPFLDEYDGVEFVVRDEIKLEVNDIFLAGDFEVCSTKYYEYLGVKLNENLSEDEMNALLSLEVLFQEIENYNPGKELVEEYYSDNNKGNCLDTYSRTMTRSRNIYVIGLISSYWNPTNFLYSYIHAKQSMHMAYVNLHKCMEVNSVRFY